jgi:hypothetical protein
VSQSKLPDPKAAEIPAVAELRKLIALAEQGDASVLPELRKRLAENASLWDVFGNLSRHAEASLIVLAAGNNLHLRECLVRKLADMKQQLEESPSPTPLERLLIERVTMTWLSLAYYEALQAQARQLTPPQAGQLQRQLDAAQRRHLAAVRALTTHRRLLPPPKPVAKAEAPVLPDAPRFTGGQQEFDLLASGVGVLN